MSEHAQQTTAKLISVTGKQESLGTADRIEALRFLHSKNEADRQPAINLQIARAYLYGTNPSQETSLGSFLFGIMAAVLSTPCTAPFMGAAAAWATTQNAILTLATFAAIGIGMAMPYHILSAFPGLAHRMPRTGPATELIKQVMGLLLLAAGAYFLGTGAAGLLATPPDPPTQAYWWVVAVFIAAAGGWLTWRTLQIASTVARRVFFSSLGFLLIAIAAFVGGRFTRGSPIRWIYFTPERLADAAA